MSLLFSIERNAKCEATEEVNAFFIVKIIYNTIYYIYYQNIIIYNIMLKYIICYNNNNILYYYYHYFYETLLTGSWQYLAVLSKREKIIR
jgi:hypothetical protein